MVYKITTYPLQRLFIILLVFPLLAGFSPISGPTDKGNEAYTAGKYDDALKEYQKAAADDPGKAVPHYNLGNAYYKKGDFEGALTEYRRAVALDPKMADAFYNAGDSLYRMGRYDEALKSYQKADSLKAGDKDTGHNISVTMKRVRQNPPRPNQPQGGAQKQGQGGKEKKGAGNGGQGAQGQGSEAEKGQGGQGGQGMSNEELQALLGRQAGEEKRLRNYFRPGVKQGAGRESEIAQMLRGFGLRGAGVGHLRPGAPYVEKDW